MSDEENDHLAHPKVGNKTLEIDKSAPGIQGKRKEFGLAGEAGEERAPGDSGRGDLSDRDRVGSHGQGLDRPTSVEDLDTVKDENGSRGGIDSRGSNK